jgi:hypothetical protein
MGAAGARALSRASLALDENEDDNDTQSSTAPSLRVLGLGSAKLGVVGAAAVAWAMSQSGSLGGVSTLDLSANDVGESGSALPVNGRDIVRGGHDDDDDIDGKAPSKMSCDGDSLESLDDSALASLARDLASSPCLRRLDLGYNSLGDSGARVVAAAVASRNVSGAFALDLQRNSIGDAGATALALALSSARALGGDEGTVGVDFLSSVDLRSNAIGEAGLEALQMHVASGRVASNYMPTRWKHKAMFLSEDEGSVVGLGGREESVAEVEVAA